MTSGVSGSRDPTEKERAIVSRAVLAPVRATVATGLIAMVLTGALSMGTAVAKQPPTRPTPPKQGTTNPVAISTPGKVATSTAGSAPGKAVSACVHRSNDARKAAHRAALLKKQAEKRGLAPTARRAVQAAYKTAVRASVAASQAAKLACRVQPPGGGATPMAR
jgi:hypothetical protein